MTNLKAAGLALAILAAGSLAACNKPAEEASANVEDAANTAEAAAPAAVDTAVNASATEANGADLAGNMAANGSGDQGNPHPR